MGDIHLAVLELRHHLLVAQDLRRTAVHGDPDLFQETFLRGKHGPGVICVGDHRMPDGDFRNGRRCGRLGIRTAARRGRNGCSGGAGNQDLSPRDGR